MARGGQAQIGHLSQDCTSLAPGAVGSSGWIFGLGCLLHEEGILLRGDSITSRIQRRDVLSISHPLEARGLSITVLFLLNHLSVGDLLLMLMGDPLFLAGLLLLHPAVLNDVLIPRDGPLYHDEGGL